MHRLGAVTVYVLIFAAGGGVAWLAGLSRHPSAPAAAFWVTLSALSAVAARGGVDLCGE